MSKPDIPTWRVASALLRSGLSVLLVLCAWLITLFIGPETLVAPLIFLTMMLSAWVGGIRSGLLAALLATLALAYFFVPPIYNLRSDPFNAPHLLVFFLSTVLVSSWSAACKRRETSLQRARDELEARVEEQTADFRERNEQLRKTRLP